MTDPDVIASRQPAGTPPADHPVDAALVRRLLRAQFPDLADRPLAAVGGGWDNEMFRLGDDLAVRLPRRTVSAPLIANEQRWLLELAPRLPLPIPVPLRKGRPGQGFPWAWSVVPWIEGRPADLHPPEPDQAGVLGGFLAALHHRAPADAPHNPFRGVPLAARSATVGARIERLRAAGHDTRTAEEVWDDAVGVPIDLEHRWIHGDPHPRNLLTIDGRLSGVVDWGDLAAGDPATDLAMVWMLYPPEHHGAFLAAYGDPGEPTRRRARGWAAAFAIMLLDTGVVDDPRFERVARTTLANLAA